LYGEDECVFADAGYIGADKRQALKDKECAVTGPIIAMKRGRSKAKSEGHLKEFARGAKRLEVHTRARVERPYSCGQEPLGSPQGPLQGAEVEHRALLHLVGTCQSGDCREAAPG